MEKETKLATLIPAGDSLAILKYNKQIATCPYRPMIAVQEEVEIIKDGKKDKEIKMSMRLQSCTSDCAKFEAKEMQKEKGGEISNVAILSCGTPTYIEYDKIAKPEQPEQPKVSKNRAKKDKKLAVIKNLKKT